MAAGKGGEQAIPGPTVVGLQLPAQFLTCTMALVVMQQEYVLALAAREDSSSGEYCMSQYDLNLEYL